MLGVLFRFKPGAHSSGVPKACAGRAERRPCRWILTPTGSKEREAPPFRPRGPVVLQAAPWPGTDESSDGRRRRKDPARGKEDSQWLVLDNPLAL
ncbi:hypothetical protein NQZ68_012442 [Dissostichus eleginoides]|nr:hypothetical protein NQZ68_012442 [Dissostichus eleginoides]